MSLPLLSLFILIPLVGSLVTVFLPKNSVSTIKAWSTVITGLTLVVAVVSMFQYGGAPVDANGMKFAESYNWIPHFSVRYYLGVDGFSYPMVLLTALVTFLATLASYSAVHERHKEYYALLLLLEVGMMGVFASLDYVLFYVFWEIVLLPMYFLIAIWGGARREYASIKFFIYTLVGSVIMLVGILALYFGTGAQTFGIMEIAKLVPAAQFAPATAMLIFLALYVGFAVKVPAFPFHTWLPDAHVEAPTPISMILAGVLLKMGTYALIRISATTLPEAARAFAPWLVAIALINIVYGALAAMAQKDFKKMVAYSSINHMGYFLLGLAAGTPEALNGALFVMISHGLISALFFFAVGMTYERTHTRDMAKLGGLFLTVPVIATFTAFTAFANLGLPGLSGFIGEFFVLLGSFPAFRWLILIATVGLVITAAFHLIMMRKVLQGEAMTEWKGLKDITGREVLILAPLVVLIVALGVYPGPLFAVFNPAVQSLSKLITLAGGM